VGKTDVQFEAAKTFREAINRLSSTSLDQYSKGNDENISGLFNDLKNSWDASFGSIDPSALSIRVDAVDAIANKIKSISGLTVSDKERKFLMTGLPNMALDDPRTFLMKTLKLKSILDMHDIQQTLKITPGEMEQIYSTKSGEQIFKSFDNAIRALEQIRTLRRNGPNGKGSDGKKVYIVNGNQFRSLDAAEAGIKEAMSAKSQRELLRNAILEAGIPDIVPPPRKKGK
jgi:hypothetical protein